MGKESCPRCDAPLVPDHDFERCPCCGFNLEMWGSKKTEPLLQNVEIVEEKSILNKFLSQTIFYVSPKTDLTGFYCRVVAYLCFFVWGWYFILLEMSSNKIGASFMHRINLVFHEAGHMLFIPFGEFMTILGGSLLQLLIPLGITIGFLLHRESKDPFSASICFWWFAQSLMDLAPYINDARALALPLLGGGTGMDRPGSHDWRNIFNSLGIIEYDTRVAWAADFIGELCMILAFIWGAWVLFLQWRFIKKSK